MAAVTWSPQGKLYLRYRGERSRESPEASTPGQAWTELGDPFTPRTVQMGPGPVLRRRPLPVPPDPRSPWGGAAGSRGSACPETELLPFALLDVQLDLIRANSGSFTRFQAE